MYGDAAGDMKCIPRGDFLSQLFIIVIKHIWLREEREGRMTVFMSACYQQQALGLTDLLHVKNTRLINNCSQRLIWRPLGALLLSIYEL